MSGLDVAGLLNRLVDRQHDDLHHALKCHPLLCLCRPLTDERLDSQEQRVVVEYYDYGVQSPQALATTQTVGADSQGSQEATTSVGSTPATASPGVPAQSMTAKPSVIPMLLDTPAKISSLVFITAQSSSTVTDTPTAAPSPKPILTPEVTMPGSTTTSISVSTAAAPEVPTAGVSTTPIVIARQLKEVRPYDGSTSWKSFREHFTRVAEANQWTAKEEQVQHLALALMGPAAEILRGFDDSSEMALDDLWGRLRHRFGTVDECQQALRDFESRRQSDSESLAEFEQVLRTLHREASPDQTEEQRDPVLKRRFEDGVASAELRQYLRLHHRDLNFRQTTETARIFAATMGETKSKKTVRFMSESPAPAIHHIAVPTIDFTPVLCRLDNIEKKFAGKWSPETDKAVSACISTPPRQDTTSPKASISQNYNSGRGSMPSCGRSSWPGRGGQSVRGGGAFQSRVG